MEANLLLLAIMVQSYNQVTDILGQRILNHQEITYVM